MAPPPPRVEAATRGDREVPTSTKNTTSKTSSDEGSNDRRAEKRYEERGLVFGVVVTSFERDDDEDDDEDDDASFYFSNASRAVAANKRTTTRFPLALATFVLTRSLFPRNKQATNGNFDQRGQRCGQNARTRYQQQETRSRTLSVPPRKRYREQRRDAEW